MSQEFLHQPSPPLTSSPSFTLTEGESSMDHEQSEHEQQTNNQPSDTSNPPPTQDQAGEGRQPSVEELSNGSLQWSMGDTTFLANANDAATASQHQMRPPQRAAAPHNPPTGQANVPQTGPLETCTLITALSQLSAKMDEATVSRQKLDDLQLENHQLKLKLAKLEGDLQGTKQLLDERSNELAIERSRRAKLESSSTASQAKKTLVLGSSIIRDLDETLYSNTEVIAQSGAKPMDLLSTLKDKEKKRRKIREDHHRSRRKSAKLRGFRRRRQQSGDYRRHEETDKCREVRQWRCDALWAAPPAYTPKTQQE